MSLIPRRDYLEMAQIEMQLFKTLQRRNQVPIWSAPSGSSASAEEADQRGYHPLEAVLMAAANKLATDGSFSRDLAADVISRNWECLAEAVQQVEGGSPNRGWIGFTAELVDAEHGNMHHTVIVGTVEEVFAKVAAQIAQHPNTHQVTAINMAPLIQHASEHYRKTGGGSLYPAGKTDG